MKVKVFIAVCLMAFMSFMFYSCGGGGSSTPVTKAVKGAAMKDFMIGAKVSIYDATGAKVDDGKCVTKDYGVFDCAVAKTATAPYTVIISGGKLDKDGKSGTATDQADASKVTLATVVPNDTTPAAANPLTTAILMDQAGVTDPAALDNGTQAKALAKDNEAIASRFKPFSGMIYVDPDKASELTSAESNVAEIVTAYDSNNFDNETGVYTGDVATIVSKLAEDMSDGSLDGKKDNETIETVDNTTVNLDNVTKDLPKVTATSVTIGGVTDDNLTDGLSIVNADSTNKEFKVTVTASNADGSYTITPSFYAKDQNGNREITAKLTGATVKIDNGSITATVADNATVSITGKDSAGNDVNATLTNLSKDILTFSNGSLTYDLGKIESKLAGLNNSALQEVFVAGTTYNVILSIVGLPQFSAISGTVTVGTPECGSGNFLKYCTTEADCQDAGGFYYDNKCNSVAECTTDNLTACTTETACTAIGKYWYDNKCNAEEQTTPAATATVTKTADVTGTGNGPIGYKASVTLPEGVTCDNCTYIWDLDSNGKVDGAVGATTVTAYYGATAQQGTATVSVVNSSDQCIAKGTNSYDLAGDALGAPAPTAIDLVSLNEDSTTNVPNCK